MLSDWWYPIYFVVGQQMSFCQWTKLKSVIREKSSEQFYIRNIYFAKTMAGPRAWYHPLDFEQKMLWLEDKWLSALVHHSRKNTGGTTLSLDWEQNASHWVNEDTFLIFVCRGGTQDPSVGRLCVAEVLPTINVSTKVTWMTGFN